MIENLFVSVNCCQQILQVSECIGENDKFKKKLEKFRSNNLLSNEVVAIILALLVFNPVGLFYAIFRLTDVSPDLFDFSPLKRLLFRRSPFPCPLTVSTEWVLNSFTH